MFLHQNNHSEMPRPGVEPHPFHSFNLSPPSRRYAKLTGNLVSLIRLRASFNSSFFLSPSVLSTSSQPSRDAA
jgi:hypothetical protein